MPRVRRIAWNSPLLLFLRSALWTILLPGMIAGYVPWRVFRFRINPTSDPVSLAGFVVGGVGLIVLMTCIAELGRRGKGTLSPLDPPQELVVTGPYRWVRNPMYIGVVLLLLGEAIVGRSGALVAYTIVFFLAVNIFVVAYEEPALQRFFGPSYTNYRKLVKRWIPRRTPWSSL